MYFTKSVFKLAIDCPTKPYYHQNKEYGNLDNDNEFLKALAEGGFQVGELSRRYYKNGIIVDTMNHDKALEITNNLLKKKDVVIFEAAFKYKNCFIRIDILEKKGDYLRLIEVKSKSFNSENPDFVGSRGVLRSEWKEYIYDVAFQKFVLQHATKDKNYKIDSYLMLADKSKEATIDGLNQKFQLYKDEHERVKINLVGDVDNLGEAILTEVKIDNLFNYVYADFSKDKAIWCKKTDTFNDINPLAFYSQILSWSESYRKNERFFNEVNSNCFNCQFKDKKSGFEECMKNHLKQFSNYSSEIDFSKPNVGDVWNYRKKGALLNEGKFYMKDIKEEDILTSKKPSSTQIRQWIQVSKTNSDKKDPYLDVELLKEYMDTFKYPLHFIDFETSMVAIPFFKGQKPYEQIAFQFSHHIIYEDGNVEHKGEFLHDKVGEFPNFEFVRSLKKELEVDKGTIFRYAPHENTVLGQIRKQLVDSNEKDKKELIDFIESITHGTREIISDDDILIEEYVGERDMVDMFEMVKNCFWGQEMGGSNSIKYVLPAVLNISKFVQDLYSKPIYGKNEKIKSLNFDKQIWIEKDENDKIKNPYKLLPSLMNDKTLDNGADAMTAYAKMQFTNVSDDDKKQMKEALLRYCELDTLAMVMIYQYWQDMIK
jgi:hypothetical protein